MNLLERYLQAIGRYLPPSTKEDTLAELRANLLAEMDERTEDLGHPLTDTEAADILRAHGKPEQVALRYLPQRSLIGPTLFPFYLYTLRKALPLIALIYAIARGVTLIWAPNQGSLAVGIFAAVVQFIPTLIIAWASVTIIFAAIEFAQHRPGAEQKSTDWDPAKLPALIHTAAGDVWKSRTGRVVDLAIHCVWLAFVLLIPRHPFLIIGPGTIYLSSLGITFAPVWHTFYILLLILLGIQLVVKILALRNGPQPWKAPAEVLTRLLGAAGVCVLLSTKSYFATTSTTTSLPNLAAINHSLNLGLKLVLFIIVIRFVIDAWNYIRRRTPASQLAF
ncbi:MAG: hypothetical protein WB439_12720 [Acidobacteriaceae bacterium]